VSRVRTVTLLGLAQTLSWASSYYLPAVLATPMARDLGVAPATVFAAFSLALILSAPLGPWAGRLIDRHGGRPVLMACNVIFVVGLVGLAMARTPLALFAAWVVIGIGMGCGLYESAFATIVRLYGTDSRTAISGVTLFAGFASTVGWPVSTWMELGFGWRGACLGWAAAHVLIGLPLNAALPRAAAPGATAADPDAANPAPPAHVDPPRPRLTAALLAFVFAATWFCSTAMAAHFPRLLQAAGASLAVAVGVGALVGPAQVAGRLLELGLLRRLSPLLAARMAVLGHPLGVLALLTAGAGAAAPFAVLHGLGNGILTITKGTLPLALFGSQGYGARQGWLTLPSRLTTAFAPVLFGLALDRWGAAALWLTAGLGVAAMLALLALPQPPRPGPAQS